MIQEMGKIQTHYNECVPKCQGDNQETSMSLVNVWSRKFSRGILKEHTKNFLINVSYKIDTGKEAWKGLQVEATTSTTKQII